MKRFALLLAIISTISLTQATVAANEIITEPTPPDTPMSPVLITSYQVDQDDFLFIQLYNNSSSIQHLEDWTMAYHYDDEFEDPVEIPLTGWLLPREYMVLAKAGAVAGADLEYELSAEPPDAGITKLQILPPSGNYLPYATPAENDFAPGGWYKMNQTSAGNYTQNTMSQKFELLNGENNDNEDTLPLYAQGLYFPPLDAPLKVVEIFPNSVDCPPLDTNATCQDYVKLYNPTEDIVDLSLYRLRIGSGNQNPGINNSFDLSGELGPHEYTSVLHRNDGQSYNITASNGNVWLEDIYGIGVYEDTIQPYEDIGGTTNRGFSWAYDHIAETWRWAVPNPFGPNDFSSEPSQAATTSTLTPCRPGQERNPETNRCRSVAAATSTLTPCRPGQERNPETNRCRNIASTTSTLTPCRPGQERNPETNRCRNIASTASSLQPCRPGQERNPETNRCRNIVSSNAAAMPDVHDIQAVTEGSPYRWWVAAAAVATVAAYAAFEWRRDIAALFGRIKHRISR